MSLRARRHGFVLGRGEILRQLPVPPKKLSLFHGTLLLNGDLRLISELLLPSLPPDYRARRPHQTFVTNLLLPAETVKAVCFYFFSKRMRASVASYQSTPSSNIVAKRRSKRPSAGFSSTVATI